MEGEGSTGKVKGLKHVSVVLKIGDCEISVVKKKIQASSLFDRDQRSPLFKVSEHLGKKLN